MMKLTVCIAFSSTNEEPGIPSFLRQPECRSFNGWDCEPRGVLGYVEGFLQALRGHCINVVESDLGNSSVRFVFEEVVDYDEDMEDISDTLILSMSLIEAPYLLACWIQNESSKCLMWASCDQVAEEFSRAKDMLGTYVLSNPKTRE